MQRYGRIDLKPTLAARPLLVPSVAQLLKAGDQRDGKTSSLAASIQQTIRTVVNNLKISS